MEKQTICGIAGITWDDVPLAERMIATIAHRGPDQSGLYGDGAVSLAHARLSIIDLTERGRQPMSNEDGSVRVVFNGEIYNFADIRKDLTARGHRFRSRTDTEVIVHAWEQYGPACVERFNGIFAFALWDRKTQTLFMARDRLGVKPLYYAALRRNGRTDIVFGSEIKALLSCPQIDRRIDCQSLYLYIGFEFVAAPGTIFTHINKLPPGCRLMWRAGGEPSVQRYWDLHVRTVQRTRAEHEAMMRQMLQESVRRQLVADVPLGVFLSGGLDSSALVAMMSRCGVDPIDTFSLYYEDETFSEIDYARYVAKQFKTRHHEVLIEPIKPELIETCCWHLDEPMTDLSTMPLYLLCKNVREHVTVCLSGEGGDELLCGYDRFKASQLHTYYELLPRRLRHGVIGPLIERLRDRPQKKGAINMLKRFIEGGLMDDTGGHMRWQYFCNGEMQRNLFSPEVQSRIDFDPFAPVRRVLEDADCDDRIAREVYVDLRQTMPDCPLMKTDKMSMAHALEVRVPILDHEFVEFCCTVPSDMKLHRFTTKAIFRSAMAGILPDHIRSRGKQGYSLPIKNWLRNELRRYMVDTLESSPMIREYFNLQYVRRLVDEHIRYKANHNHVLWALINLAVWHRVIVMPTPAAGGRGKPARLSA